MKDEQNKQGLVFIRVNAVNPGSTNLNNTSSLANGNQYSNFTYSNNSYNSSNLAQTQALNGNQSNAYSSAFQY